MDRNRYFVSDIALEGHLSSVINNRWQKKPYDQTHPRVRLSNEVFAGRVTQWKNNYGWIHPLEKIDHPEMKRYIESINYY